MIVSHLGADRDDDPGMISRHRAIVPSIRIAPITVFDRSMGRIFIGDQRQKRAVFGNHRRVVMVGVGIGH